MDCNSDEEVVEEEVDTDDEKAKKPPTKKKRYSTKFQKCWLIDEQFKDWIEERGKAPFCKVCKTNLSCAKTALVRHKDSSTHKKQQRMASNLHQSYPTVTSLFASQTKPARIEIKLCAFIAENNLPISLTEDLVALLKNLFPSEGSLQNVKLGKQKATNIIRQVLGFYSVKEVITKLKTNPFSLIIDETTDRSTKTQLAILGSYFDEENFKLDTFLIDLVTLPNGTATTIYESVIKCLSDKCIPMKNVIGFSSDTCNVMFGKNHSVAQMLVKDYPWIMAIKCTCHMIHLCSSYACKKLPKSMEDLCRNIYSHFSMSPKRSETFIEFQEFFNLQQHKILSSSQTRWLSMKGAVERILEQYSALKLYFTSEVIEDPTHTNESILRSLNNKFTLAYLEFMNYSLGRFASFNLLFQSETPLLHQLKDEVEKLILSICGDILEMSYIRSVKAFQIDAGNKDHQVPLNKVYLGVSATETIREIEGDLESSGLTSNEDIQLFRSHCRNFLIEAVAQIQDRFADCQNMDHLSCLSPVVAFNLRIPSLNSLYKEMPHLERVAALQSVDPEWREHALNPKLSENQTTEEYWQVVFKERDVSGKPRYPHLTKVMKVLLSLPFSNVAAERLFSQLKLVKTDHRSSLKQESLVALLTTKMAFAKSHGTQKAAKFEPPRDMLDLHKAMKTDADNDEVAELRKEFIKTLKKSG